MTKLSIVSVLVLLCGCSIITDLDDYTVADGSLQPEGGTDAGADGGDVECGLAATFETDTDLVVQRTGWEPGSLAMAVVFGKRSSSDPFEIIASAIFANMTDDQIVRMPGALLAGTHQVVGVQYNNGEVVFAWRPELCSNGTLRFSAPDENTPPATLGELANEFIDTTKASLHLRPINFDGPHVNQSIELAIERSGRVDAYFRIDTLPDLPTGVEGQPDNSFELAFPEQFEPGMYNLLMWADVDGDGFDPDGAPDHSWQLVGIVESERVVAGMRLEEVSGVRDPRVDVVFEQRDGLGPVAKTRAINNFVHASPLDQLQAGEWPITNR